MGFWVGGTAVGAGGDTLVAVGCEVGAGVAAVAHALKTIEAMSKANSVTFDKVS
jgi:hypothetical protein